MSFAAIDTPTAGLLAAGPNWRDRLERASFKGVPFYASSESWTFGRRLEVNEYPGRELPWTEDNGRRADRIQVAAFVVGEDYDTQRDALIRALREPGAGELILSRFGAFVVEIDKASVRELITEGRYCAVQFSAVEKGQNLEPSLRDDTRQSLLSRASAALDATLADFLVRFSEAKGYVAAQVPARLTQLAGDLVEIGIGASSAGEKSAELRLAVDRYETRLAGNDPAVNLDYLDDPAQFGAELQDLYRGLGKLAGSPVERNRNLKALRNHDSSTPEAPLAPYLEIARGPLDPQFIADDRANHVATANLARQAIAIVRAQTALEYPLSSIEEIARIRAEVLEALDDEIEIAGSQQNDASFAALRDLRAALLRDLEQRGEGLPHLVQFTPPREISTHLLSQRLYATGARADELATRIRPEHPAFLAAGVPIWVPNE